MKSIHAIAFGLAAALVVPSAFAQGTQGTTSTEDETVDPSTGTTTPTGQTSSEQTTTTETETTIETESTNTESAPIAPSSPQTSPQTGPGYMGAPAVTTTTTPTDDVGLREIEPTPEPIRVKRGLGINAFGAFGTRDSADKGFGGRVEYVFPLGLSLGASYTVHIEDSHRTAVRPLLAEVGWGFPVGVRGLELRPIFAIGYGFANTNRSPDTDVLPGANQDVNVNANLQGLDIAPSAKVSYLAGPLEVYTMPRYHIFRNGNNWFGVEVGAGARF